MTEETDTEERLLRLVRQGDHTAMRAVYTTYVRYLTAVCSRYIPNDEDAKDVLQDSFLRIFSSIATFSYRGPGSLKAWMTRITVNEALKHLQRECRISFVELSDKDYEQPDAEPDMNHMPPQVIFRLIRSLPDGYRTIFNLYVIEEHTHKEIARMLSIKESTSASQLHRAKNLLAAKIRQYQANKSLS